MNGQEIDRIRADVQRNCHVSDARHGGEYGLCSYLMKMREYYRWEKGLTFSAALPKEAVGEWLTEREKLWADLGDAEFEPVVIGGREYDPFDSASINRTLLEQGLVYSGGLGHGGKPHFFLGELERAAEESACSVLVSGRELARDLAAPPAMSQGGTIVVRRESLRRVLWEKLESWRWRRPDNALSRAFACYDFEADLHGALDRMADDELELVLLHEQGEVIAGEWLGDGWNAMLTDLEGSPAELVARAVRDHIADCVLTLPRLVDSGRRSSIHFYLGNLQGFRELLFPSLKAGYEAWIREASLARLERVAREGERHWKGVAEEMLRMHGELGARAGAGIMTLSEACRL